MTLDQVKALLADECEAAGSQAAWGRAHDIAPGFVSDVLHGREKPSARLLDALGLEREEESYREKGTRR